MPVSRYAGTVLETSLIPSLMHGLGTGLDPLMN